MSISSIAQRLASIRRQLARHGLDALLVRSADQYLNEYVPPEDSQRIWISGFTGSMGEVVVGARRAYLLVDGRYWLQADREVDADLFEVVKVPLSGSVDAAVAEVLAGLKPKRGAAKLRVGYDPAQLSPGGLEALTRKLGSSASLEALTPSPISLARQQEPKVAPEAHLRILDEEALGSSVPEKLAGLEAPFTALGIQALLVQKLDEIAYLSNLRGDALPYQATFRSLALVTPKALWLALAEGEVTPQLRRARPQIRFVSEEDLWKQLGPSRLKHIGYDRAQNSEAGRLAIEARGAHPIAVESPLGPMKAKKNPAELKAMVAAFRKADAVVAGAVAWLCRGVLAGKKISEAAFATEVEQRFVTSGATGLSFRVISAAGKNGAVIHYSDPSPRRIIKRGELMLLDTGAYYAEGYATDLTRTFLVAGARARGTALQRRHYTLVLRSAIAGMSAVLPVGARGGQLDALVRAPLWAEGLNFNHGTGHGVGINVHESPPRIGPNAVSVLEEGFVFSIEPRLYLPSFGGVRIENLCTLEPARGRPGFLAVKPLTFSPLDERLIEKSMLTPAEAMWLKVYAAAGRALGQRSSR